MEPMDSGVQPMSSSTKFLLFVCLGNFCRSPALAAVMEKLIQERALEQKFFVDSMGLTTHYLGRPADLRIRAAAGKQNISINHTAQLFKPSDFQRFDWIFAVDHEVLDLLSTYASTPAERDKLHLATAFSKKYPNQEILDPFPHGEEAFDRVIDMALDACDGILEHLSKINYQSP